MGALGSGSSNGHTGSGARIRSEPLESQDRNPRSVLTLSPRALPTIPCHLVSKPSLVFTTASDRLSSDGTQATNWQQKHHLGTPLHALECLLALFPVELTVRGPHLPLNMRLLAVRDGHLSQVKKHSPLQVRSWPSS